MRDIEDEEFDSVEEVEATIEEFANLVRSEYPDLTVAVEIVTDAADDDDMEAEDLTLPFYEDDREAAFLIGLTTGALLETREQLEDE